MALTLAMDFGFGAYVTFHSVSGYCKVSLSPYRFS